MRMESESSWGKAPAKVPSELFAEDLEGIEGGGVVSRLCGNFARITKLILGGILTGSV